MRSGLFKVLEYVMFERSENLELPLSPFAALRVTAAVTLNKPYLRE